MNQFKMNPKGSNIYIQTNHLRGTTPMGSNKINVNPHFYKYLIPSGFAMNPKGLNIYSRTNHLGGTTPSGSNNNDNHDIYKHLISSEFYNLK